MSGEFVKHLKTLGYPDADKLKASDYDWLYENPKLHAFLHWFTHNTDPSNHLTDEQIQQFTCLQESEGILRGDQLKDALQASNLNTKQQLSLEESREKVRELKEKLKKREAYLEDVTATKQALTTEFNLGVQRKEKMLAKKAESAAVLRAAKEEVVKSNAAYNDVVSDLEEVTAEVQQMSTNVKSKNCNFLLSQQSLENIQEIEMDFNEHVNMYIEKQMFNNNMSDVTQEVGCLELVQEPDTETYELQVRQMQHLKKTYPLWKAEHIQALCRVEEAKAKAQHIENTMKGLHQLPTESHDITSATWEKESKIQQLEREIGKIEGCVLPGLLSAACSRYLEPVTVGNARLKETRQRGEMCRQEKLLQVLSRKLARGEWLLALLEVEKSKVLTLLRETSLAHSRVQQRTTASTTRLRDLHDMKVSLDGAAHDMLVHDDDYTVHNMSRLLVGEQNCTLTFPMLLEAVTSTAKRLEEGEKLLPEAIEKQTRKLHELSSDLTALEKINSDAEGAPEESIKSKLVALKAQLNVVEGDLGRAIREREEYRRVIAGDQMQSIERENWVFFYTEPERLQQLLAKLKDTITPNV